MKNVFAKYNVTLRCQLFGVNGLIPIEIVARRLPQGDGLVDNNTSSAYNADRLGSTVAVFNRQLFVLKCNAWGGGTLLYPSSGITTFNENQVLSNQSLYVELLQEMSPGTYVVAYKVLSASLISCSFEAHF